MSMAKKDISMKKYLLLIIVFLLAHGKSVCRDEQTTRIKLVNPILEWLDGVPKCLDGWAFRDMLHMLKLGNTIHYGIKNTKTNKLEGQYHWQDKNYSIAQLARIEKSIDDTFAKQVDQLNKKYLDEAAFQQAWQQQYKAIKDTFEQEYQAQQELITRSVKQDDQDIEHVRITRKLAKKFMKECNKAYEELKQRYINNNNLPAYKQEYDQLKKEYELKKASLEPVLTLAKKDFRKIMDPYLEKVKGLKKLLFSLVAESCRIRHRDGSDGTMPSFLLKWAEAEEGKEFDAFEKNIKGFQDLDHVLTDLANFFKDLIESCPKGWAQCQELLKQQNNAINN